MKPRLFLVVALTLSMPLSLSTYSAHAKSYIAYISDSSNSSVVYWIAKEAGIFKKYGLDFETIFIDGSVRGIQSLLAGDLGYTGAVGLAFRLNEKARFWVEARYLGASGIGLIPLAAGVSITLGGGGGGM